MTLEHYESRTTMPRRYIRKAHPRGWVRIAEAAAQLAMTRQGVLKLIADDRLIAEQPGGPGTMWYIEPKSLARAVAERFIQ